MKKNTRYNVCIYCDWSYDKTGKTVAPQIAYPPEIIWNQGCCNLCHAAMLRERVENPGNNMKRKI